MIAPLTGDFGVDRLVEPEHQPRIAAVVEDPHVGLDRIGGPRGSAERGDAKRYKAKRERQHAPAARNFMMLAVAVMTLIRRPQGR